MSNNLPDPRTAPELFDTLLTRRVIAYFIDLAIILALMIGVILAGFILGLVTMGAAFVAIPIALPIALVTYYAVTLGSPKRATVGMQMMDIVLTPTRGAPLDGWRAFFHPLLFWVTCWILPPFSYLVALFTPRRQMIHDYVLGTLMVRRSPMERHWRSMPGRGFDMYPTHEA